MKPFRTILFGSVALLGLSAQADAGWQNVFQVACFGHCNQPATSHYADPCCNPCPPQKVCTTRYLQRSYYQPVTSYENRTYYEPVTTYRTSYYYEPVTTYRYTSYYDPCTCSCREVATPCTSYQLRSQCCPVQSWTQRCCKVPVTTYRQCYYWEPQTCCSLVDPCSGNVSALAPAASPPAVTENQAPAVPRVEESRNGGTGSKLYDQYNRPPVPANPNSLDGSNSSYRYAPRYSPAPLPNPAAKPAAPIVPRPERIASYSANWTPVGARLTGTISPE